VPLAFHTYTRLIPVLEGTGDQQIGNASHGRSQGTSGSLDPSQERSFGALATVKIRQQFTRPRQRHQLLLMQVHPECAHVRPIRHGSLHASRKRPGAALVTGRAPHVLHLMVSHHQMHQRYIMYLTVFFDFPQDALERRLSVLAS
jgi:hypothetical protein